MKRIILTLLALCQASICIYAQAKNNTEHQNAKTRFIEVKGTKFAYRTLGRLSGTPLILLQHFTGTLDNWDPAVTDGLAKNFQVILLDNKGIGASEGQTPESIEEMAHDVASFIKAMGFKKVNVLGFSMGGFIAQQLTLFHPELIDKLILAGTGPKGGEGIADIVKPLTASSKMNAVDQKLYLFYNQTPVSTALGRQAIGRINSRIKDRDPDAQLPAIQAQLKSIISWGQPDANALAKLKEIRQPVLVVNGNNDIVVPTINSYTLFQNLPNARLSLYPDSGHGSIFQYPELFLGEAIPFLKQK